MKPSDFDLQTGVASLHWALVPTEDPLDAERDSLREDLIQVVLDSGVVLDVGWYPSFSINGRFRILVVRDEDWDTPALMKECRTLRELNQAFVESLALARALDVQSQGDRRPTTA